MLVFSDPIITTILSAGIAGTTADLALHPLDTMKTRIQSSQGFLRAGGFRGLYKGLSVVVIGSAPESALFFCTYEGLKVAISERYPQLPSTGVHMASASVAEVVACSIRVPTEVVKQRMQMGKGSIGNVVGSIMINQGWTGLFTGFGATIMREIPYAFIQFPIYEYLMDFAQRRRKGIRPESLEAAVYGSISGAIAAAITTPLDVCKTRLMLSDSTRGPQYSGVMNTMTRIVREEGPTALLRGLAARVTWIGLGGFVLFGAYEQSKRIINEFHQKAGR